MESAPRAARSGRTDIIGQERRGASVEQVGGDRRRAAHREEDCHLGMFGRGFEDDGIVAAARKARAGISARDVDEEDIGEGRKQAVVELPAGSQIVVEVITVKLPGRKGPPRRGYDPEPRCGKRE